MLLGQSSTSGPLHSKTVGFHTDVVGCGEDASASDGSQQMPVDENPPEIVPAAVMPLTPRRESGGTLACISDALLTRTWATAHNMTHHGNSSPTPWPWNWNDQNFRLWYLHQCDIALCTSASAPWALWP